MKIQRSPKSTPLPGIVTTLKVGFECATNHWWLALLPAFLDAFYWLGPRLSPTMLVERATSFFANQAMFADVNQQLLTVAQQTNLFTSLTVPLIGVPTLMRLAPEAAPLSSTVIEIQSFGAWFLLFMGLSLGGFLLTAVYFNLIAQAIQPTENGRMPLPNLIRHILRTWGYLLLIGIGMLLVSLIILFPLMIIGTLLSFISPQLVFVVLFSGMMFIFWLAIFLGFTPHGLTLNKRTLPQALLESIQLVRLNYVSAITLLLVIIGISMVMDQLMRYADNGSWITLSSILGHAFISTALIASSYVFYQDRISIQLVAQRHPLPIEQTKETRNG
jgi:hypothetical protein